MAPVPGGAASWLARQAYDKYCTAVADNVEEARKLLEIGFEYVCCPKDEMLFRKRK